MTEKRGKRKVLRGIVTSDKMQKTVTVEVERRFRHPVFKKVVKAKKRYKAHNPDDNARLGDLVEMMETKPLSKEKRWRVTNIIRKARGAEEQKSEKPKDQNTI